LDILLLDVIFSTIECKLPYCPLVTILAPVLHKTILSEKNHWPKIKTAEIIIIGKKPRPKYAKTVIKIMYKKANILKQIIILIVIPVSLFLQELSIFLSIFG